MGPGQQADSQNFQVDLGGMVELLSRNLYSGPRVFVRELLQNGFDAITARRELEPEGSPARIRFITDNNGEFLSITDTGIGLTRVEAETLLSTIGGSSKRDEFGLARSEFLGQFGIGLLSCFMVSLEITVFSRSAKPDAPEDVVLWQGRSDGTWTVRTALPEEVPAELQGPGTTIVLKSLPGERFFDYPVVSKLIDHYGRLLPVDVTCERRSQDAEHLSAQPAPWEMSLDDQQRWCIDNFGFQPFACIPLEVSVSGVRGVAFIIPQGAHPGQLLKHHVYLRRMLLSTHVTDLLPEWAYFARVVVDTEFLRPTASRESLFDDSLLEETRQELGDSIRQWLGDLAEYYPLQFQEFVALHVHGLKALALTDDKTRELVCSAVPFQTSLGMKTLQEVLEEHGGIRFTSTDSQFRALLPVASASELCIVNAGFAFDEELLAQVQLDHPGLGISELDPLEVLGVLEKPNGTDATALRPLLDAASAALGDKASPQIRQFQPSTMPVLYLPNSDVAGKAIEQRAIDEAVGAFEGLVDLMNSATLDNDGMDTPQLIFNANCTLNHQLAGSTSQQPQIVESAIRGLFVQALLAGKHPMDSTVRAWSTQVFSNLITASLR